MDYQVTIPDDLLEADLPNLAAEVEALIEVLKTQLTRIRMVTDAAIQTEVAQQNYHTAVAGSYPEVPPLRGAVDMSAWFPWRQPTGAHNAYAFGWVTRHDGKLYMNERPSNIAEPGTADSGWLDVTPGPGEPLPEAPDAIEWMPWEAWHEYLDGRNSGVDENGELIGRDYVEFAGIVYGCVQSHKSQPDWTPDVTPALWVVIGPVPSEPDTTTTTTTVEGETTTTTTTGAPDPVAAPWTPPEGGHDAYPAGAVVSHNGQEWTSDLDGNVWEPGVYGWTVNP